MIITFQQLKESYSNLTDVKGKIARDIKKGKLFPLVKGIYETNSNAQGARLAQYIYGPSYLSFDYVLFVQSLIPETVYNTFTCATFNKKKRKTYTNKFGTFIYRDVPSTVYNLGVIAYQEEGYSFSMATAEKALCDKLYILPPVKTIKDLRQMLFEDLRIDKDKFKQLNMQDILDIAPFYHSTNLNLFSKYIKGAK